MSTTEFIMGKNITSQADQKGTKVSFTSNLLGLCARIIMLCSHKMPLKTSDDIHRFKSALPDWTLWLLSTSLNKAN